VIHQLPVLTGRKGFVVNEAVAGGGGLETTAAEHDVAAGTDQPTGIDLFPGGSGPPPLLDRSEERVGFPQVATGPIGVVPVDGLDQSREPVGTGDTVVIGKGDQVSPGSADAFIPAPRHSAAVPVENLEHLIGWAGLAGEGLESARERPPAQGGNHHGHDVPVNVQYR
jgi:hypothetical protein